MRLNTTPERLNCHDCCRVDCLLCCSKCVAAINIATHLNDPVHEKAHVAPLPEDNMSSMEQHWLALFQVLFTHAAKRIMRHHSPHTVQVCLTRKYLNLNGKVPAQMQPSAADKQKGQRDPELQSILTDDMGQILLDFSEISNAK